MPLGLHAVEDVLDFAVGTDDESGPGDPHDLAAVHILLFHHAEFFGNLLVRVGEQGKGEAEFVTEFLLRAGGVGGNAKQHGAGFLNLLVCVAEPARFYRSTGRIGFGIKEKNHRFA